MARRQRNNVRKSYKKSRVGGQHSFAQVARAEIPRSKFTRSHGHKTTFDGGLLIPIFVDDVLPGDTMKMRMSTFARLATPLVPVLDNMHLDSFFFFVPNRLLWDNWQKFCGEQDDPGDSISFVIPIIDTLTSQSALSDYMGIPPDLDNFEHSAMFHRAYNLIWKEWFRDENLQDSPVINKDDGPDVAADYPMRSRGKRHDYFTSCLPFPQKGTAVPLPLSGSATLILDDQQVPTTGSSTPTWGQGTDTLAAKMINTDDTMTWASNPSATGNVSWVNTGLEAILDDATGVVDLSTASSASINELRLNFQIQKLLERDARGGSRYTEILRSHFGVTSPDQRLQRPEYLGGGSQNISVTPIPQTSRSETGETPQGTLAAYGISVGSNHSFQKSFTEHGVIIGLVSVRADLNYQQGVERMFTKSTRYDFFWPALSHIGEQAVLNQEIFADGSANDIAVFGYQERWAEYRYKPSRVSQQFRSAHAQSLDIWHLAQEFSTLPALNDTFIQDTPPIDRIIATQTDPHFLCDLWFDYGVVRPIPTHSTPGLIDHF